MAYKAAMVFADFKLILRKSAGFCGLRRRDWLGNSTHARPQPGNPPTRAENVETVRHLGCVVARCPSAARPGRLPVVERIGAGLAQAAGAAGFANEQLVGPGGEPPQILPLIGEETRLEIALVGVFGAHPGSC